MEYGATFHVQHDEQKPNITPESEIFASFAIAKDDIDMIEERNEREDRYKTKALS